MFQLTGIDAALAAQKAQHVLAFETELAKCSLPIEDCQDPNNLYHIMSRGELQASTPIFDWDTYFDAIGLRHLTVSMSHRPISSQPSTALSTAPTSTPLRTT
jgi:Predicted metalloendopeptidase